MFCWRRGRVCLVVLFSAALTGHFTQAKEPYLAFLRGLQERGYGEQALEYIDAIADKADAPAELKATLDLERSKSLRIAAGEAYDAAQRQARLAEAKRLAEKFFADNPAHPLAGAALMGEADESLAQGQYKLAEYRAAREPAVQTAALEAAKTSLKGAAEQYDVIVKRLQERLERSAPPNGQTSKDPDRQDLEFTWLDCRFKSGLASYFLAQTFTDPKAKEREELLKSAGKVFDDIFQEFRTSGKPIAMLPHMWHGKVIEELGDETLAFEVYDEVLAVSPEGDDATEKNADLAAVFGQAQLFQLRLMGQKKDADLKNLLAEAQLWLDMHKKWHATSPAQGIALEAAKLRIKLAETARGATEKAKLIRDATTALAAIGKADSEYRQEALLLRREAMDKAGGSGANTIDDKLALADESVTEKNWAEAETIFRQAIDQAKRANDAKRAAAIQERLAPVLYQQALVAYSANEMETVLTRCGEIVRDNANLPVAESASSMAVAAALDIYTAANKEAKPPAFARLEKIANFAIQRWPDAPAGDDSRMALAQALLTEGKLETALTHLAGVTNRSKRYATALQILGQIHWKQYLDLKKAPDAADRSAELQKLRDEALVSLKSSVEKQQAGWQSATEPMPASLFDTQLLLADAHLEGQQAKEAAGFYAPLVAEVVKHPPMTADLKTLRVLVGATRAQLAAGDHAPACEAALLLAKLSSDAPQPNTLLVDLAKLLAQEIRKIEAEQSATPAPAANATPAQPGLPAPVGNPATVALRDGQGKLLEQLATRQQLSIPQMIYVGDASSQLGKNDKARDIYQRLLDAIDKDEAAKAAAGPSVTRIRARLVGLLRSDGKLEDANKQVDALLKSHPNALEPLMEKGYILEALAAKDPKRGDECVAHWTNLRMQLGKAKPRPPEYYEVLYNAAHCLVVQARQTKNKDKALQAEQMLKSTMTLTPKLSGPDMVAKYKILLASTIEFRGKTTPHINAANKTNR